jgi:tetratricopeptide (TPR) repeat protein
MSIYFQKDCPDLGRSSVQVQGKGLARFHRGTLLRFSEGDATRSPASSRRHVVQPQAISPSRPAAILCINRDLNLKDCNPDMPHLRQQALTAAQRGDYDQAIATFNALLESCPRSAVDYNNRGLIHFQAGNLDRAIADYNHAIELNPCLDSAYNNRANYHASKGNFLEAILDYDIALDLNPDNVRAWINQGITFRDLRMYNRALENFNAALKFHCLQGHIYTERGRTHHLSGDWNWAIADYTHALQLVTAESPRPSGPPGRLQWHIEHWMNELLENLELGSGIED